MCDFKVGDVVYFNLIPKQDAKKGIIKYIDDNEAVVCYSAEVINHSTNEVEVQKIHDSIPISNIYNTKKEAKKALKREFYGKVNEVKKDIHTLEDLLKFMYNNDLTDWSSACVNGWQTDWVSRVAVRELAKEICGIELGE